MVVADYGFDRPAPEPTPLRVSPCAEWRFTPGASPRLKRDRLTVSFDVLPDYVSVENGRISVSSTRRTIDVDLDETALTNLVDGLSHGLTLESLAAALPAPLYDSTRNIVEELIGWGAVVDSIEARPRVTHEWSMRGASARNLLSPSEMAALTFSTRTRGDDGARIVKLAPTRPFPIDSLSTVLRQRRSPTSYDASPISLDHLGQMLGGACGVTGELVMADSRLPLRAYPSPGALYGVDVYVIPTRVEGLPNAVFRYAPERHALVTVHDRRVDPVSFCLPDGRAVVGGIAAFIALSICLPRATSKYGDVSYRILIAEAGCIAENLVLVAHALGLRAGPFTGVFDSLVDQAIGLGRDEARFVVGVLVGRDGGRS
jgi:SagB-type dehydrogenase family enzyme